MVGRTRGLFRTTIAVGAVLCALLLTPVSSSARSPDAVGAGDQDARSKEDIEASRNVRELLGFPTDPATEELLQQRSSSEAWAEYRVAMTKEEASEFAERQRVSDENGEASEYAETVAGFAGAVSRNAGEYFDYQFTQLAPSERAELERLFPDPHRLRVVLVERSLFDLNAGVERLSAYLKEDMEHGEISWLGPDIAANGITVGVDPAVEGKRSQEELQAVAQVPVTLAVGEARDDVCTSRTNCDSPQRAGVRIVLASVASCSSGYIVRTTTNNEMALTAGHCFYGYSSGTVTSGATFGTLTTQSAYGPGSSADARLVETVNSTTYNWLYHTTNPAA